eukprot:CAMPEP_0119312380 /NCGR_PEP_ID=MMETSP1333-20130426/26209_1 /TAXON_ID=418940 /ORGANISM="Scyphosphaera apsteinii, Strain RCC1455" /LENGTH=555 /DNA_ID=CAMNT_0007316991 /DNA_START=1 /DNA_END=1668 /DNA_ORIENTATION=+
MRRCCRGKRKEIRPAGDRSGFTSTPAFAMGDRCDALGKLAGLAKTAASGNPEILIGLNDTDAAELQAIKLLFADENAWTNVRKTDEMEIAASSNGTGAPDAPPFTIVPPCISLAPSGNAISFTHPGGAGRSTKENQDACFMASPAEGVDVFAVFDGHGKRHGRLAARIAAEAVKAYLSTHHKALVFAPAQTMKNAFDAAHVAICAAINDSAREAGRPTKTVSGGTEQHERPPFLIEYLKDESAWDAAEGGTTATVAALVKGRLIVAAVGDSSSLLLGRNSQGGVVHELLVPEHSPSNPAELTRVRAMPSVGEQVRFAYDCPDGTLIDIFDSNGRLEATAEKRADELDCAVKNCRGDLSSGVFIPSVWVMLPSPPLEMFGFILTVNSLNKTPAACGDYNLQDVHEGNIDNEKGEGQRVKIDEQTIAMTRSLGDSYAHHFGLSHEPEVRELLLTDLLHHREWRACMLMLASDGVWDLWKFDEVGDRLLPPVSCRYNGVNNDAQPACVSWTAPTMLESAVRQFCEYNRAKGEDFFGETADNFTGVLVDLAPWLCTGSP